MAKRRPRNDFGHAALVAAQKAAAKEAKKSQLFGVFVHRGDGRYAPGEAVKTYKSRPAAEKYAAQYAARNYVVREIR